MKHIRTIACLSLLFAARGAFAADKVCKVDIAGTDQMTFDKKEIAVAADCTEVEVTLKHTGKLPVQAMGHNWVLDQDRGPERRSRPTAWARDSPTITSRRATRA